MGFDFGRIAVRAARYLGPKARKRREKIKIYRNRAVRRAERYEAPEKDTPELRRARRAARKGPRVAAGYPGEKVFNRRGKFMGLSAKESREQRLARRAKGVGRA